MENTKYYCIDSKYENYLSKCNNVYSHVVSSGYNKYNMIQCDIEEKWMKELVFDKSDSQWKEIENTEIKRGDILDLSENGERWEGDSLNGNPHGYGCIYNTDNQLIYKGFVY